MGTKKKSTRPRAYYKVTLDRAVVCALRVRAAKETLAGDRSVTWLDLLRQAAEEAAK